MCFTRIVLHSPSLAALLRRRARDTGSKILLFVDQFDELFSLTRSAAGRQPFLDVLLAIADDVESPLRVVVSMRSDSLDSVAAHQRFSGALRQGLFFLSPLEPPAIEDALEKPARMAGYRYEKSDVVTKMIDCAATSTEALSLVQFSASMLWADRNRERKLLTKSAFRKRGGVVGALANRADEVLSRFDLSQQTLVRRIFQRLVTAEGHRGTKELSAPSLVSSRRNAILRKPVPAFSWRARSLVGSRGGWNLALVPWAIAASWQIQRCRR